ncbi:MULTISPECIES: hypothetical protein [Frankia]|uniref:hypothetical protein n=1 Tax=Frankia TaxID=1854 RepID=UPI0005D106A9|nr:MULTISPECIES: hypothetical protein [Frankia]KQC36462.1 hypothetical protein UK82_20685 [Frankia sp. ACN1ag]
MLPPSSRAASVDVTVARRRSRSRSAARTGCSADTQRRRAALKAIRAADWDNRPKPRIFISPH